MSNGRQLRFEREFNIAVLDSPAPSIEISFPFVHARYDEPAISVSGHVQHPQIENVVIAAQAGADRLDGEITDGVFRIRDLPIAGAGRFTLTVTASHPGGDMATETMSISSEPELTDVPRMVLDAARDRILMVDRYTASIVATPLDGGERVTVSGKHVGAGPAFIAPVAVTMNTQADELYVFDDELHALLRVNLATGERVVISDQSHGSGPALWSPTEMDFDTARGFVIVSDESQGVVAIDPATGDRRVVSSSSDPGPQIHFHRGIGYDALRDRYLVHDSHSLFAVNPVTGVRSMLSDWLLDPTFGRLFRGMSVASESGAVFIGEEMSDGVLRIDLSSGARQQMTSSGVPAPWNFPVVGSGPSLQYADDVVFDAAGSRLFVVETEYADPLMQIGANGDRTVIRDAGVGAGVHFRSPSGIKYDIRRRTLLAADYVADLVVEIDPATGNRTSLQGPANGRGSIHEDPMDVAFNARTGLFYAVDFQARSLYSIDAVSHARVVIADAATGSGPQLFRPQRIELDVERGTAYVADPYYSGVFAVNLGTGARSLVQGDFAQPVGLALDSVSQQLFVADGSGAFYAVQLASGATRQISAGNNFLTFVAGMAYDSATNKLIVIDDYPARLYAIDAESGIRTMISGQINFVQRLGHGPQFIWPRGVAVDPARQVAFVTDDAYDAVIAVDLRTGSRQLIAK